MPPRYAYWTIIAGGLPTAFRAAEKDELLPTFHRIQEKQPDAVMKFFARGKLWDTPEQALRAEAGPRGRGPEHRDHGAGGRGQGGFRDQGAGIGDRDRSRGSTGPRDSEHRGRDWRPGGEHRDPRQPFKDAKKARNEEWRQERWDRKNRPAPSGPPREKPHGDPMRDDVRARPPKPGWRSRPSDSAQGRPKENWRDRPKENWRDRDRDRGPRAKPHGDPMRDDVRPRSPKQDWRRRPFDSAQGRPFGSAQGRPKESWRDRPQENWRDRDRDRGPAGPKTGSYEGYKSGKPRYEGRDREHKPFRSPTPDRRPPGKRPFNPKAERQPEPPPPPRPRGPNREPRPSQEPPPEPPPRPGDATIPPPGPPERGGGSNKGGKLRKKS